GLGGEEALMLALATEEVFMHLCRVAKPAGGPLEILCSSGGCYAQVAFSLPDDAFDMRAFNLTATVSVEDDADLDAMGLVIASRSVDRLSLSRHGSHGLRLELIKEKSYPPVPETPLPAVPAVTKYSLRPPDPEEWKFISHLCQSHYKSWELPRVLRHPGRLADVMSTGGYGALAAVGDAGEIAGAVFWHALGEKVVECLGPYVFNQAPDSTIPEALLEGCIGAVARTPAVGMISTRPTARFPRGHFEFLGTVDTFTPDGSGVPIEAWFRLLDEDTGATSWTPPELEAFLRREYSRLVLPRELRVDRPSGESLRGHSVLSAELDAPRRSVTLRPLWPGADAQENIARHVRLLRDENILDMHFEVDLGQAWQGIFVPGLFSAGFEPRLLLPHAGRGDVVLFQLRGKNG
ncbi:MAG: hypothetical protein ABFD98_09135, partial [Syntrophobacteraceae bacterium]